MEYFFRILLCSNILSTPRKFIRNFSTIPYQLQTSRNVSSYEGMQGKVEWADKKTVRISRAIGLRTEPGGYQEQIAMFTARLVSRQECCSSLNRAILHGITLLCNQNYQTCLAFCYTCEQPELFVQEMRPRAGI
jgi:hypothetical protein